MDDDMPDEVSKADAQFQTIHELLSESLGWLARAMVKRQRLSADWMQGVNNFAKNEEKIAERKRDESVMTEHERRILACLESVASKIVGVECSVNTERFALRAQVREADNNSQSLKTQLDEVARQLQEIQRRRTANSSSSPEVRQAVLAMTSGQCLYCDVTLTTDTPGADDEFCIDHLVPKAAGGPDHVANYVPACRRCDLIKRDRPVLEFARGVYAKLRLISSGSAQ